MLKLKYLGDIKSIIYKKHVQQNKSSKYAPVE